MFKNWLHFVLPSQMTNDHLILTVYHTKHNLNCNNVNPKPNHINKLLPLTWYYIIL